MMHAHVIIGDNSAEFGQICMDILRQSGFTANTTEKDGNQLLEQIDKDYCAIIGLNQKDLENQGILA